MADNIFKYILVLRCMFDSWTSWYLLREQFMISQRLKTLLRPSCCIHTCLLSYLRGLAAHARLLAAAWNPGTWLVSWWRSWTEGGKRGKVRMIKGRNNAFLHTFTQRCQWVLWSTSAWSASALVFWENGWWKTLDDCKHMTARVFTACRVDHR